MLASHTMTQHCTTTMQFMALPMMSHFQSMSFTKLGFTCVMRSSIALIFMLATRSWWMIIAPFRQNIVRKIVAT